MADSKENYLWDLGSKRVKEDINKWIPVIFYPAPNTQFFFLKDLFLSRAILIFLKFKLLY